MKAIINISGQVSGNFTIKRNLHNYDEVKNVHFGGFQLCYSTIERAVKDLRQCWKDLKDNECVSEMDVISRDGKSLNYDASSAIIEIAE